MVSLSFRVTSKDSGSFLGTNFGLFSLQYFRQFGENIILVAPNVESVLCQQRFGGRVVDVVRPFTVLTKLAVAKDKVTTDVKSRASDAVSAVLTGALADVVELADLRDETSPAQYQSNVIVGQFVHRVLSQQLQIV
jgi:hypothetical protein